MGGGLGSPGRPVTRLREGIKHWAREDGNPNTSPVSLDTMRFSTLLATISLALASTALPSSLFVQDEYSITPMPEAGELLSVPLAFGEDEFAVYETLADGGNVDAAIFDDWKNQVVNQHNAYRRKYGAPNLSWSDALYSGTQQWASQCKFQHR